MATRTATLKARRSLKQITGSNLACVWDHNQLLVLHTVRTQGPLTRRDLSRSTGLTFQTIENISRRLIDAGILEDVRASTGVNRARQLALRPTGAHAVGVEVTPQACRIVLCDLAGRTVAERRQHIVPSDSILDEIAQMVHDLIDDAEVLITTVIACGFTVGGPLQDVSSGPGSSFDHGAPSRQWMRMELERRLQMPALYSSGVIAAARSVQWVARTPSRDFIYLHLAFEIGCAVVSHGQLCTGARGRGGDIAHTPAVDDGELCDCGRRGCLHTLLTERGLRRAVATALDAAEPPTLEQIAELVPTDQRITAVVERVAGHVVDALLPAVQMLDPETIMIGGSVAEALGAPFCSALHRRIASSHVGASGLTVQEATPRAGGAVRAAHHVLYENFAPAIDHLVLDTVSLSRTAGSMGA
jgi:predicted NBD/HSP70 family sugar kinase